MEDGEIISKDPLPSVYRSLLGMCLFFVELNPFSTTNSVYVLREDTSFYIQFPLLKIEETNKISMVKFNSKIFPCKDPTGLLNIR